MEKDHALYLRLSDDFGGTQFGPFTGVEVAFGSAPSNQIQIPESFGVEEYHAKILVQEGRGILLSPISQTTQVFLWKGRSQSPSQISTPTAVREGDSFALVSPHGPKFHIEVGLLPEKMRSDALNFRGKENLTKDAMKKEARRQALLSVMTTGWGQRISRAWWFVRSGEIFLPRNLFMFAAIGGGWIMGTLAMCSKADTEAEVEVLTVEIQDMKEQMGDKDHITLAKQLARVTGIPSLEPLFRREVDLAGRVRERAKVLYGRTSTHSWISQPSTRQSRRLSEFLDTHEAIQGWSNVDSATRKLMPWANVAREIFLQSEDNSWWGKAKDSRGEEVCTRGPLGMTWPQATQLGMTAQLDLFSFEQLQDGEETTRALRNSALRNTAFDRDQITPDMLLETRRPEGSDNSFCYVGAGSDDRDSLSGLRKALRPGREGLPEDDANAHHLPAATLMKFFAADTRGLNSGTVLDFRRDLASGMAMVEEDSIPWITDRTAETIAAAAVLPCIRKTEYRDEELPSDLAGDDIGSYQSIDCILLRYVIEYQDVVREQE